MKRDWKAVIAEHTKVVAALGEAAGLLDSISEALVACFRAGGRVYLFGNGGSAADAQHIAGELLGRFRRDRQSLPAIALSTDTSTLTAIANDMGFDRIFARQIEGLVRKGDVAWGLSTSGNSPNVLAALRAARECGAQTIGFSGASGGRMADLCTWLLRVPHTSSDRIQEGHALAYHYVCERVEAAFTPAE